MKPRGVKNLDSPYTRGVTYSSKRLRLWAVLFLAAVILFGQLGSEVLYSVDGIVYAVVGQELNDRPFWQWAYPTWKGAAFLEHPPLTPWLLGLSFRLFGESTLSALLVPALLSWLTVWGTYCLGRRLKDETAGLLAAFILALTPQFIKAGRNPMLEPALQFFITLSVLYAVQARQEARHRWAAWSGVFLGLAWLAKGPPALLALGVTLAAAYLNPRPATRRISESKFWLLYTLGALAPPLLFELWHAALGYGSFWAAYFGNQLRYTVVEGRGHEFDWTMYLRILFVEYQPWIWPAIAAIPTLVARKAHSLKPLAWVGLAWTLGTVIPFTLMRHKAPWYIHLYYPGLALLAASFFAAWISSARIQLWIPRIAWALALPVVLLSSTAPSLFQGYGRPGEWFLQGAKTKLGRSLEGQSIADCMGLGEWRSSFFYRFYFRAEARNCADASARYQVLQSTQYSLNPGHRIIYARDSWLLVDRRP